MAKLNRNKTLSVALIFIIISSCTVFSLKPEPINTEVFCPNLNQKILIRNVTSDDFLEALNKFNNARKERDSNEDYTVLVFRNKHSMHFKGIKSEELLQCVVRDVQRDQIHTDYLIYY